MNRRRFAALAVGLVDGVLCGICAALVLRVPSPVPHAGRPSAPYPPGERVATR